MPSSMKIPVKDLCLDTSNYRTTPQPDEIHAVQAMTWSPTAAERFWALVRSLAESGYLPTENILILESASAPVRLIVKDGNRRIAALKLILGYLPPNVLEQPEDIKELLRNLPNDWAARNQDVPCTVYTQAEESIVDSIVSLAHGKGEKAARLDWPAVAKARHNRSRGASEPGLDLLERYLSVGNVLTEEERRAWAIEYPLTILDEALQKVARALGVRNARELVDRYLSAAENRDILERIVTDIGRGKIQFTHLRPITEEFRDLYGIPVSPDSEAVTPPSESADDTESGRERTQDSSNEGGTPTEPSATSRAGERPIAPQGGQRTAPRKKTLAVALSDPRSVRRVLKKFRPAGPNREKVVMLRDEACNLDLNKTPLAFCFLLRSMFEISAKAYCQDHGIPTTETWGYDRKLVDLLTDVTQHLIQNSRDDTMKKRLHGALVELAKKEGLLSVTSMNQLVHNPNFSIAVSDIAVVFHNIFPLLEEMNG